MRWAAVIVAAGRGARLGRPKQFLEMAGLPMVGWSIQTFAGMDEIAQIVVATEAELIDEMRALVARLVTRQDASVVAGGAIRQESAYAGLRAVTADCDGAFVHDGARPLVTPHDVRAGMRAVRPSRGALLAMPVADTIKEVAPDSRRVVATLDRGQLWAAETPQFALSLDLLHAHRQARRDNVTATDDAALLERVGIETIVIPSTAPNFKVTLPDDVARAESILRERTPIVMLSAPRSGESKHKRDERRPERA
ncbi:MAG: 2-C-methyl-D-erythritol 4-phosphate cytidylyltransferase [Candidatus Eremiobacteraeota bacterium]|nr:2-C-methyl-D-erythritol 4-phosphate cytidylyltransferase [Candidatus Eremiobacteraeota bacterium]